MNYIIDRLAYEDMFGAYPKQDVMSEGFVKSLINYGIVKDVTNERYAELKQSGRLAEIANNDRYIIIKF